MSRFLSLVLVAALTAACTSDAAEETSTTTARPSDTTTATTVTTTTVTTTTVTTTTGGTATTIGGHPGLPVSQGRDAIPWEDVDSDWVLALVSGERFEPSWEDGPRVLYLIDPDGALYEVQAWEPGPSLPWLIHDWSPDGRRALIAVGGPDGRNAVDLIDLQDGSVRRVMPPSELGDNRAGFTAPTGRDLVLWTSDGATEHLEVVYDDLSPYSALAEQPHSNVAPLTWLYGQDGTTVLVGDSTGLHVLGNDGGFIADLASPGTGCRPLKWWGDDTILASCIPADWAEADSYFHQLWLVPLDGPDATAMTAAPAEMPGIVDFGYVDAWQAGEEVFLQWAGDCAAATVDLLVAGTPLLAEGSGPHRVIGTAEEDAILQTWDGCDQSGSALLRVAVDGSVVADLVPRFEGVVGVLSAVSNA